MAIVTLLAIETVMAIVTVLAIETDMAIVTALAIETDIHARNSFQGSLRGTVHVSFINAEVAKTVTSLLRRCPSLAWDTLSRSDLSCYS